MKKYTLPLLICMCATHVVAQDAPALETPRSIGAVEKPENQPMPVAEQKSYFAIGVAGQHLSYKIDGERANESYGDVEDMGGVTIDIGGYNRNPGSKAIVEAGLNFTFVSGTESVDVPGGYGPVAVDNTFREASLSLYANFNFELGSSTKFYIGPRIGIARFSSEIDAGGTEFVADATTAKLGLGVGIKQQLGETFGVTLGVDWSSYSDFNLKYNDARMGAFHISDMSSTKVFISASWTF